MAINYNKVGWDTTKYFNPSNMNHMDNGIKAACDKADANESAISSVSDRVTNNEKAIEQANSNLSSFYKNNKISTPYGTDCTPENGYANAQICVNVNPSNGSRAGIGLHNAGFNAALLYFEADGYLYLINNTGQKYRINMTNVE